MASTWIDFQAVKAAIPLVPVLERYGVRLRKVNGTSFRSNCPLPSHRGKSAGTFSVNAAKNVFQCFSCTGKGNVLDFVAAMENVSVRDAALRLTEWFPVSGERQRASAQAEPPPAAEAKPENKPLAFQLKGIQHDHPYLRSRGFERALSERMGVGFFPGTGSMAGRVVFPIHDEKGELVAYAGRLVDDSLLSDEIPRWKLPKGFHKSLVLYNLHRVLAAECDEIIVVESFWGVLACLRAGYENAVALMGRTVSEAQARLLERFVHIVLALDGDEPGLASSIEVGSKLLTLPHRRSVRVVFLPDGVQPDTLDANVLQGII